jgi:hypothetical protein
MALPKFLISFFIAFNFPYVEIAYFYPKRNFMQMLT